MQRRLAKYGIKVKSHFQAGIYGLTGQRMAYVVRAHYYQFVATVCVATHAAASSLLPDSCCVS
jgi:hypothetical protein